MFARNSKSSVQTSSSAEADQHRVGVVSRCPHLALWLFLQKLIDEENSSYVEIIHVNAGQPPMKKKAYERFEKRLLNLISTSHRDVLNQIDAIAQNISLWIVCLCSVLKCFNKFVDADRSRAELTSCLSLFTLTFLVWIFPCWSFCPHLCRT